MISHDRATYGGNKIYVNGETIALTMAATMERRFADARRIALCLNMHDRLVNALKDLCIQNYGTPKSCGHTWDCMCADDNAAKLLAEMEGKS